MTTAKSRFNTTEAGNTPRKLSLKDPFTGVTLKDDDGATIDFYIYGAQSDNARNAHKARERRYGKNTVLGDDEAAEVGADYMAAITQGWTLNLSWIYDNYDVDTAYSRKRAVELYKNEDWIARQVLEFSLNNANYDPQRFLSSGAGSESLPGSKRSPKSTTKADGNS